MSVAEQAPGKDLAAGWMKDPSGRHFGRYWDGEQWTDHVISAETEPSIDPVHRRNLEPERTDAQEDLTEPASTEKRLGRWERDPSGRHSSRYWDGRRWTEHVMSSERVPSIDPVPQRNLEPHRTEPAGAGAAAVPIKVEPASADSEPLGSPRHRPLPRRAGDDFRAGTRSVPWALAVIVCGLVIIGLAVSGSSPRPMKAGTDVTGPVATTAPSAAAPMATTIPLTTEVPITVPGAPADTGAPATTPATAPGTVPGSQSPVTSPPSVDPSPTVPHPGESTDPSMSTTS